ncbi:hypothetical protein RI054_15g73480 [Pseudoscourfieldia marina]
MSSCAASSQGRRGASLRRRATGAAAARPHGSGVVGSLSSSSSSSSSSSIGRIHDGSPEPVDVVIFKGAQTGRIDLSGRQIVQLPKELIDVLPDIDELSLAGNALRELPVEFVRRASRMRKLNLAGNELETLPDDEEAWKHGLGARLDGLWLHGNRLKELPDALFTSCPSLENLSVAGNALATFGISSGREGVSCLPNLRQLNISGNRIERIPDGLFEACNRLVELSVHGNRLTSLPRSLATGSGVSLRELFAQGNRLTGALFGDCHTLPSHGWFPLLEELSVADNQLTSLVPDCARQFEGAMPNIAILHAYGNQLEEIPDYLLDSARTIDGRRKRRQLYIEDNTLLDGAAIVAKARERCMSLGSGLVSLTLGLDNHQAGGVTQLDDAGVSVVAGACRPLPGIGGYVKVVPIVRLQPDVSPSSDTCDVLSQDNCLEPPAQDATSGRVMVVSFASAPGLPNWGGVLGRVAGRMQVQDTSRVDVCFVCDARRTWYADPSWQDAMSALARDGNYAGALLLGDSMGATGAVLCAGAAASVIGTNVECAAFCPQVDLTRSSIRPFEDDREGVNYADACRRVVDSARVLVAAGGRLGVHCGTWEHDAEQAYKLAVDVDPNQQGVQVTVHGEVHDHRVAYAMEADGGRLSQLVERAIEERLALAVR